MPVTEQDKIELLLKVRRDKIFMLTSPDDDNCGIVYLCIKDGLLENITPYTTRLTKRGIFYLEALDFKTSQRQKPKYIAAITKKIIFIKYIPNRYWQLLIAFMTLIVALWAIFK